MLRSIAFDNKEDRSAMTHEEAKAVLSEHGQEHVLRFWEQLDGGQRDALLGQIEALDFNNLARMRSVLEAAGSAAAAPVDIEPAPVVTLEEPVDPAAQARGEMLLRDGKAGAILVAGGQGSRLGYDGPKGCYELGPLSGASLFEIHARKVLGLQRRFGRTVPFYVMTSELNDAPTRTFFEEHAWFGLDPAGVRCFKQGMWPAMLPDGRLVLETPSRLFMSPDGHGGIVAAMKRNGVLDDMRERGLTTLFYFQVDNPLVEIADPLFIGRHSLAAADVSVKVCAKRSAGEGLGVVVHREGRTAIVEYSELTDEQKEDTGPDGRLRFLFGSVAIHVFDLDFLVREADAELPIHLAHKKVPVCGDDGVTVTPDEPNAYKFEKFIFDVLPDAKRALCVEFDRAEEFSPVKNAEGDDSPATARRDMMRKFARWFEDCGVDVPRDADGEPAHRLEIDPAFAANAAQLKERFAGLSSIEGDVLLADAES